MRMVTGAVEKRGLTSDLFLEVESTRFRHGKVQLDKKWLVKGACGEKCVLGGHKMRRSPQPYLP